MNKTFTLENMETYFSNYISCNEHKKEPITNFCTESPCLKFMCPECIEQHSSLHSNHVVPQIPSRLIPSKRLSKRHQKNSDKLACSCRQKRQGTLSSSLITLNNTQSSVSEG